MMPTRFEDAYARILAVTNCQTQVEVAEALGIRQSSVSDAKKRGTVPAEWLVTLLQRFRLNPDWILTGQGRQFLVPTETYSEEFEASQCNRTSKPDFESIALDVQLVLQKSGFRGKGVEKCIAENRSFLFCMDDDVEFSTEFLWIKKYTLEISEFLLKLHGIPREQVSSSYVTSILNVCGSCGENICRIQDMNRALFIFSKYINSGREFLKFALSGMEDCEVFFEDLKCVLRKISFNSYKDNVYPWVGYDYNNTLLFASS